MTSQPPEDDVPDYIAALRKRLGITPRTIPAWIEALLQGDEKAWNDLIYICLDTCKKKLPYLSEEVASEAIASILHRIRQNKPLSGSYFEVYAIKVCNNKCIDAWRRAGRLPIETNQEILDRLEADSQLDATTGDQQDAPALDELVWMLLQTCVQRLGPDKQRLAEDYFQGKGPKEIAQERGPDIPEGRISKQWFDIRKKINSYIDRCESQLSQRDRILFGLYLDRTKNKYRKKQDEASFVEEQSPVRTTRWVLQQLVLIKDAADREDHARLITLQEQYMLGVPLEGIMLPTPLGIDWVTDQLRRILREMCNYVQGLR